MTFTKELKDKAKTARTAKELAEMAKAEGVDMTADEAEKAFAKLQRIGELADEELDNVSGGCGDPEPDVTWGGGGRWDKSEDVVFDFAIGTRVVAYITPSTWKKGTVTAREPQKDDWGWYPAYLIRYDDSSIADEWMAQSGVGKLL